MSFVDLNFIVDLLAQKPGQHIMFGLPLLWSGIKGEVILYYADWVQNLKTN